MKREKQKAEERAQIEMARAQKIAEWKRGFSSVLDENFFKLFGTVTPRVANPPLRIKLEVYQNIVQVRLFHVVINKRRFKFTPADLGHVIKAFKTRKNWESIRFVRCQNSDTNRHLRFVADFLVSAWEGMPESGEIEKWEED